MALFSKKPDTSSPFKPTTASKPKTGNPGLFQPTSASETPGPTEAILEAEIVHETPHSPVDDTPAQSATTASGFAAKLFKNKAKPIDVATPRPPQSPLFWLLSAIPLVLALAGGAFQWVQYSQATRQLYLVQEQKFASTLLEQPLTSSQFGMAPDVVSALQASNPLQQEVVLNKNQLTLTVSYTLQQPFTEYNFKDFNPAAFPPLAQAPAAIQPLLQFCATSQPPAPGPQPNSVTLHLECPWSAR